MLKTLEDDLLGKIGLYKAENELPEVSETWGVLRGSVRGHGGEDEECIFSGEHAHFGNLCENAYSSILWKRMETQNLNTSCRKPIRKTPAGLEQQGRPPLDRRVTWIFCP